MAIYQPRPYQKECMAALAEARTNGLKKGLVVMASGLGKTMTVIFDLQQFLQAQPHAHVLYLCHQESILAQSKAKFKKVFGDEYSYGMFTGHHKTMHAVTFLFATFQTMCDHRDKFAVDAFDYVIVDEAHHTVAETYQPTVDYFTPQFLLGLTATKDRMDGQNILDTYGEILYRMDIYDGWEQGWLARVDYRIMLDDLKQEEFEKYVGPHATTEKVSMTQLNKTIFAPQHDEGIVASIHEQTADLDNPSAFVFCSSIEHAKAMAYCFEGEAAVTHSGQSYSANQAVLSKFRAGKIRIIISVNMLNEGIDVPETDVVVFLRSTESSTVFFQQLGRGLRISGAKRTVRVLDYVANIERISTILEMETTAKEHIQTSPTYAPSADKPEPLVVNIPATKFEVRKADMERLLTRIIKAKRWTREEIIESLQSLARKLGKNSLLISDIRSDPDAPSDYTIRTHFGSSFEGIRAAGLEPEFSFRGKFETEAELFAAAREYAAKLGHPETITTAEIENNRDLPSWSALKGKYKTIANFRRQAGFASPGVEKKKKASRRIFNSKEEIDAAILRKSSELGGNPPSLRQLELDQNCPSRGQILKYYLTIETAFVANGFQVKACKSPETYTFEAQKAEAVIMQSQLGRAPSRREWDANPKTCSVAYLVSQYGSHNNAMLAFGLKPNEQNDVSCVEDDKLTPDLIDRLRSIVRKVGRPIFSRDLVGANDIPSYQTFRKRGWTMQRINEYIGADQILAELEEEGEVKRILMPEKGSLTPRLTDILQGIVRRTGKSIRTRDLTKTNGVASITAFYKRGWTLQRINEYIGADQILAELEVKKNN